MIRQSTDAAFAVLEVREGQAAILDVVLVSLNRRQGVLRRSLRMVRTTENSQNGGVDYQRNLRRSGGGRGGGNSSRKQSKHLWEKKEPWSEIFKRLVNFRGGRYSLSFRKNCNFSINAPMKFDI